MATDLISKFKMPFSDVFKRSSLSIKLVEKHCHRYLENYIKCAENFPQTWQIDCKVQSLKLQKCVDSNPVLSKIKTECADVFAVYENCMIRNGNQAEKCMEEFEKFSNCGEKLIEND